VKVPSQPPVFASPCVVDTNVIFVANGLHPRDHASLPDRLLQKARLVRADSVQGRASQRCASLTHSVAPSGMSWSLKS